MNPMLTRFPESVRIDGVRYPLNTDFRVGLRIMSAYEDPQLTRFERQVVLCRLLYQEQPSDFTQAVREGVRFLDGGEQPGRPAAGGFTALTRTGHTSIRQSCRPTG